jgi:hypothetical protein
MNNATLTRAAAVTTVLAVSAIAATVSYSHIVTLALDHGQPSTAAHLLPFSIDGLVVAASLAMLSGKAPGLSRLMLGLGVAATVGANVAFGWHYGPIGVAVSAWPAIAFLGSVELLARMTRRPEAPEVVERRAEVVEVAALDPATLLAAEPSLTGADLGRALGLTPPSGQRIKARLAAETP